MEPGRRLVAAGAAGPCLLCAGPMRAPLAGMDVPGPSAEQPAAILASELHLGVSPLGWGLPAPAASAEITEIRTQPAFAHTHQINAFPLYKIGEENPSGL